MVDVVANKIADRISAGLGTSYIFTVTNRALTIHVPIGYMPPAKAEEHLRKFAATMVNDNLKSAFGVDQVIIVPRPSVR